MKIDYIVVPAAIQDKLETKHRVTAMEAREVLLSRPRAPRNEEAMDANRRSSVSQADSLESMGEFWDQHDFTEFDDPERPDVKFEVRCAVPVESRLLDRVERQARRRGVSTETLVNLWLQQKLAEAV